MIVATAGHVDHGKSTLVRALTGVDPDRLPEEKRRGMTIDLGFVCRGGIAFVDVPGHERFIHNMLAGVSGIDLALLVVAADDGAMPQTHEHLAILRLAGAPRIVVAVTKIDRVPAERTREVLREVATLVPEARSFAVSSLSGKGLDALGSYLGSCGSDSRRPQGNFRLSVDRVFTLTGAGLVVTGTALDGEVRVGDEVRALLAGTPARVRGLHVHNAPAQNGSAGQRIALNLSGLNGKAPILRGDWIVAGAAPGPVRRFDARLASLAEPIRHGAPVLLHLGAARVRARVFLLAEPYAQVVCERPIGAVHGDRFIARDASARRTLCGGTVIDIFAPARGRSKPARLACLEALAHAEDEQALQALARHSPLGVDLARFAAGRNRPAASGWHFAPGHRRALATRALSELAAWHAGRPDAEGMAEGRLLDASGLAPGARELLLEELVREGRVVRDAGGLRLPAHQSRVAAADEALWRRLRPLLERGGLRPPTVAELAAATVMDRKALAAVLGRLARHGLVTRVTGNRYYLPAVLARLEEQALAMGTMTAAAFRDHTGLGRGLTIELLEFFDRTHLTRRVGDAHVVRQACAGRESHPGGARGLQIR